MTETSGNVSRSVCSGCGISGPSWRPCPPPGLNKNGREVPVRHESAPVVRASAAASVAASGDAWVNRGSTSPRHDAQASSSGIGLTKPSGQFVREPQRRWPPLLIPRSLVRVQHGPQGKPPLRGFSRKPPDLRSWLGGNGYRQALLVPIRVKGREARLSPTGLLVVFHNVFHSAP
jgi:hypothetical protein